MAAHEALPTFSVAELQQLTDAVGRVHRSSNVREALCALTQLARELVPSDDACAWLAPAGTDTEGVSAWHGSNAAAAGASSAQTARKPWSHGKCGVGALRLTQAELEARGDRSTEEGRLVAPVRGCLAVPLVALDGSPVGTLELSGRERGEFTEADERLLSHFAQLASQALESVRLRTRVAEQEERLRLALEAASLGTWEHIPSTHATHWDARSKAMFGYAPDETFDFECFRAALHADDVELVFAGMSKAVDPNGTGECSLQYRIRGRDGSERWVEAHGRCVFDAQRVPLRINGTLLDITARKRAEDALRESNRRKDQFLALLGHELRNPLAPMRTALELMRQRSPEHAVREREVLERQLRHMMRLVDDLLDVSRIARGTVNLRSEPLELELVVARAVEMASPLLEERAHQLEVQVEGGLELDGDAVRLAQVVSNLLNNAARYTPRGGKVRVHAGAEGEWLSLHIEDNGIGIAPEELAEIFEPFVQSARTADGRQGGLGLGLSLVRDLVKLHGGTVEAHSAGVGQGSRFTVRLPASTERASAAVESTETRLPNQHALRVLLVDDNEDAAELMGLYLEEQGHEVRVALDGPEALELAATLAPEVAVVDLGLPVMDGFELAERLRQAHGPGLRLIALTGYGQPEDRERTRNAGFDVHLVKPVDPRALELALTPR